MQQSRQTKSKNSGKCFSLLSLLLLLICLGAVRGFLIPPGAQQLFELSSKVSLEPVDGSQSKDEVSYNFESQLKVSSVWSSATAQLLQIHFSDSRVSAPGNQAKAALKQRPISSLPDRPFYVALINGQPHQVIAHSSRDQSLLNLERGIASLLKLRPPTSADDSDEATNELDVSGHCRVHYHALSSTRVQKLKKDCSLWDLRVNYHPEQALGVAQQSQEQVDYELGADGTLLRVESTETHRLTLAAKPDAGSLVRAILRLQHVAQGGEVAQLKQPTLEAAVASLMEWYRVFALEADVDGTISELKQQTLQEQVERSREQLQMDQVGKSSLAASFAQLVPLARVTKQLQFGRLLRAQPELAAQLVDLMGAVQTHEAHNASFAHFYEGAATTPASLELLEKYLQSLAVGTHPERSILEQLFDFVQQPQAHRSHAKLRDTALQTLATLTRLSGLDVNDRLLKQIRVHLLEGITSATEPTLYARALQNLRDPQTIDALLQLATQTPQPKLAVAALQALKSFSPLSFAEPHRRQFESVFYQRQRRFDSSARTLALDILLGMRPGAEQLGQLLDYLASTDRQFEIKTYVLQKLRMLAEICPRFRAMFRSALAQRAHVNNYNVLGQRGLTTVLSRQLSQSPAFNETFLSSQEVYQGILKRGSVEFLLHAGRAEASSFKLGIYTVGLGSLVGDGDSDADSETIPADDELESEETITAGMEISVQGAQLRPLIFFNGQTELMAHVWGGSASDTTPAYQSTTLAQDHEHYIVLASGATLHWRVLGARSVDLNGKVSFSLWNRNAQTEIQQNTGSAVVSHLAVGFTYAKLVQDLTLSHEPKLSLRADLDFYTNIKLCMQLQRPEQLLTQSSSRSVYLQAVEKPYAKHLRSTQAHKSAGCTFVLNQKNNEMCNMILEAS